MSLCSCGGHRGGFVADRATPRRVDPTGTTNVRRRWEQELVRRFKRVRSLAWEALVKLDVLGLGRQTAERSIASSTFVRAFKKDGAVLDAQPAPGAFAFGSSQDKLSAFMDWLYEMQRQEILGVSLGTPLSTAASDLWANVYVDAAYKKGMKDAAGNAGIGGEISASFALPIHADKVGLIYSRVYRDLEGITDLMDAQISRVLAAGLAEGRGPMEIARELAKQVDNIGIVRARTLARTEVIRAHAEGSLNMYEEAQLLGVTVESEFATAEDDSVCPVCEDLQGRVFTLDEARGVIPVHPNCRCAFIPVVGEPDPGSPVGVAAEIEASLGEVRSTAARSAVMPEYSQPVVWSKLLKSLKKPKAAKSVEALPGSSLQKLTSAQKIELWEAEQKAKLAAKQAAAAKAAIKPPVSSLSKKTKPAPAPVVKSENLLEVTKAGKLNQLGSTSFSRPLTVQETTGLRTYTGSSYEPMNLYLRKQTSSLSPNLKSTISEMDKAFRVASLDRSVTVYRGVHGTFADAIKRMQYGDTLTDPGFMSTSVNSGIAQSFSSGVIMKFTLKQGAKAIDVRPISSISREDEILLARGTTLRYLRKNGNVHEMEVVSFRDSYGVDSARGSLASDAARPRYRKFSEGGAGLIVVIGGKREVLKG